MELSFLGTGSAYNPAMKNTSAYAVYDNTLLLIDCGETVFETLFSSNLLHSADIIFLAVTHFHSDHIGSIGSMFSYCSCILKKKIFLLYPTKDLCTLLGLTGVSESMYEYCSSVPGDLPFDLVPIEVQHDPMIKCYGYYIKDADGISFYGGDSIEVPSEVIEKLHRGEIIRIYQDTTYEDHPKSTAHGTLRNLAQSIEPELRDKVTCMHFGYDFTAEVEKLGFIPAKAEVL